MVTNSHIKTPVVPSIEEQTQKHILDLIVNQDDISWKAILFDLIEHEQMDPWDINISLISQKFLEQLKKLKEMDFRISGKVVLASAVLLKLKAERLRDDELAALDRLMHSAEEPIDLGLEETPLEEPWAFAPGERPQLIPRTPQPRKRKVSIYDLVEALEKALELDASRPPYIPPKTLDVINPPEHHVDMSVIIREVYDRIYGHYEKKRSKEQLMFHNITRSDDPRDIVMTFIPLLHLENARKIDMEQEEHFGPIGIQLLDKTPPIFEKTTGRTRATTAATKRAK
jgi:segregation and condensation protein A